MNSFLSKVRTSFPSIFTEPAVGGMSRSIVRPKVVFPDPDSPTIA